MWHRCGEKVQHSMQRPIKQNVSVTYSTSADFLTDNRQPKNNLTSYRWPCVRRHTTESLLTSYGQVALVDWGLSDLTQRTVCSSLCRWWCTPHSNTGWAEQPESTSGSTLHCDCWPSGKKDGYFIYDHKCNYLVFVWNWGWIIWQCEKT